MIHSNVRLSIKAYSRLCKGIQENKFYPTNQSYILLQLKPNREMLNTRIDLSLDSFLKEYVNIQTKTPLKIPCIVREVINVK